MHNSNVAARLSQLMVHPNHLLICAQAQAAERTLWAPLNGLALTFLDDELVDRVRTFELAVKDLASTAVNSRGADPSQVNAKAIARVTKLHAECVAGLDKVFKRVNALAAPDRPLVASATARSGALYTDYVKNVAQCQQAGGPMVSVQTGGLVCGPAGAGAMTPFKTSLLVVSQSSKKNTLET